MFRSQSDKKLTKSFSKKMIFTKVFVWTPKKQFYQLCGIFLANVGRYLLKVQNCTKNQKNQKICFLELLSEPVENSFENLFVNFVSEVRKHFAQSQTKRRIIFKKTTFFIKVFVWTLRKQFLILSKKNLQEVRKSFDQSPKKEKFSKKNILAKCSAEFAVSSFNKILANFMPKVRPILFKMRI